MMVVVTGVSGSGKSTLVHDVIFRSLEALHKTAGEAHEAETEDGDSLAGHLQADLPEAEGADLIHETVMVDQSPDRTHAALESGDLHQGLRCHPRPVRVHQRGGAARLYGGSFFLQHSRRPLRDLPGRRHGHGGDAVSGRCGADLRRVQRHALQERHSGNPLQRPEHSRSPAAHGGAGAGVLSRHAAADHKAQGSGGCGAGIPAAGAIGDHAFGRRGAAREAGGASGAGILQGHALHLRRTDHRPAFRRHREAAGRRSSG